MTFPHLRYNFDVDKEMTVVKLVGTDGEDIGMIKYVSKHACGCIELLL